MKIELEPRREARADHWSTARNAPSLMWLIALIALAVGHADTALGEQPAVKSSARLPSAKLDGNYFSSGGKRFISVGVHWVPAVAAMHWAVQWNPKEVEADFAQMAQMGFNTVRFDLMWAWFEPRPGDYNAEAFKQFDHLIALAHKYRIYLHPTLLVGGEVGEAYWDVPWRHGRDPQADPEMLRLETNHAREFGRRYANETAILAWDLTDEPPFWISSGTTDAMAVNWTRLIGGGIRKYDTTHPIVVGVATQDMMHGPFRPDVIADDVDFFSVHPYTIYTPDLFPDPMVSERGTYGAAFETTLSRVAGKPVMVQELGASSAQYSPQKIAEFDRVSTYSALGAGANGFLLWSYTDAAPEQYNKIPYLRSPHETQFGLTTWDRKLRPQGSEFVAIGKVLQRMNLERVEVPLGDVAIVIPEEWSRTQGDFSKFGLTGPEIIPYVSVTDGGAVNGEPPKPYSSNHNQWVMSSVLSSFILAHRAGWRPDLPREYAGWERYPLVLLPAPLTATDPIPVHVHTNFWQKATAYVNDGGVLYASLAANSAIPEMTKLFGARMVDAAPVTELILTVTKPFGDLRPGETFHFAVPGTEVKYWGTQLEVDDAEVIAVDQEQRPALVARSVGKGKTLLAAYPLETYLGNQPSVFEKNETTHRLYRALREWSAVHGLVSTDQPSIEAASLNGNDGGYFVLANHSRDALQTRITTTLPVRALKQLTPDGTADVAKGDDNSWTIDMPAYGGVVLEWRKSR